MARSGSIKRGLGLSPNDVTKGTRGNSEPHAKSPDKKKANMEKHHARKKSIGCRCYIKREPKSTNGLVSKPLIRLQNICVNNNGTHQACSCRKDECDIENLRLFAPNHTGEFIQMWFPSYNNFNNMDWVISTNYAASQMEICYVVL